MQSKTAINYGQDAPTLLRTYFIAGILLGILGGITWLLRMRPAQPGILTRVSSLLGIFANCASGLFLLRAIVMIWSSRVGKVLEANRLLNDLHLRGDETVLDVGCGRGLLLIGAAKRLPRGRALGIDLWSQVDQADNREEATLANARLAGVAERVEVVDGDMQALPFSDETVDVVVANKAIHNIPSREGRRAAIQEIVRVLKPRGRVALMDMWHVEQFGEDLRDCGMLDVRVSGPRYLHYPFMWVVTAMKPWGAC